jgi:hypothetical protein
LHTQAANIFKSLISIWFGLFKLVNVNTNA